MRFAVQTNGSIEIIVRRTANTSERKLHAIAYVIRRTIHWISIVSNRLAVKSTFLRPYIEHLVVLIVTFVHVRMLIAGCRCKTVSVKGWIRRECNEMVVETVTANCLANSFGVDDRFQFAYFSF